MVAIEGEVFRGREGIDRVLRQPAQLVEELHDSRRPVRDLADLVVMLGRLGGRARMAGIGHERPPRSSGRDTGREMSEESTTPDLVRLARQGYAAISRGDLDGVMSLFAADAVYDMSAAGLETFEGAEAIRGFVEDWYRSWEEYDGRGGGALDLGHGVVLSRPSGGRSLGRRQWSRRAAGGAPRQWTNGKIEWHKHYLDPDEARAAAERLAEERG